jgi:molecular chaperone GrpE (heat shock protein)
MRRGAKKSSPPRLHERPASAAKKRRPQKAAVLKTLRAQEPMRARTPAESDNYRKRVAKARGAAAKAGVRELVQEILLVQDGFDRAFQSEALRSDHQAYQAVRSIQRQVHQLLEKQGIMSFESIGQAFNPAFQQIPRRHSLQRSAKGLMKQWTLRLGRGSAASSQGHRSQKPAACGKSLGKSPGDNSRKFHIARWNDFLCDGHFNTGSLSFGSLKCLVQYSVRFRAGKHNSREMSSTAAGLLRRHQG